ncbi:MAG: hypothetical protein ACHREM_05210 [Polyangiales bacterium]
MDTVLVRLKSLDPRRGYVLRRYTYAGIKFQEERGWYRVTKAVAEYLRTVHQVADDAVSPLAFDVLSDEEAKALDAREEAEAKVRRSATDDIRLSEARTDAVTTADLAPRGPAPDPKARKDK